MKRFALAIGIALTFVIPCTIGAQTVTATGERLTRVTDFVELKFEWDGVPQGIPISGYKVKYFIKQGEALAGSGVIPWWDPVGTSHCTWKPAYYDWSQGQWVHGHWEEVGIDLVDNLDGSRDLKGEDDTGCNCTRPLETCFHEDGEYKYRVEFHIYRETTGWTQHTFRTGTVQVDIDDTPSGGTGNAQNGDN